MNRPTISAYLAMMGLWQALCVQILRTQRRAVRCPEEGPRLQQRIRRLQKQQNAFESLSAGLAGEIDYFGFLILHSAASSGRWKDIEALRNLVHQENRPDLVEELARLKPRDWVGACRVLRRLTERSPLYPFSYN